MMEVSTVEQQSPTALPTANPIAVPAESIADSTTAPPHKREGGPDDADSSSAGGGVDAFPPAETAVETPAALEARVAAMRAELRELEAAGRGLADAHARATREIRLRQAVEGQRAAAEAEAARLREELRAHEMARLSADRASHENAEIANQWKERSDSYETALERAREEASSAKEELQQKALQYVDLNKDLQCATVIIAAYAQATSSVVTAASGWASFRPDPQLSMPEIKPASDAEIDDELLQPSIHADMQTVLKQLAEKITRLKSESTERNGPLDDIKAMELALEERSALVKQWEDYATHWEARGREAERLNVEWEASFDALQDQYSRLALDRAASSKQEVDTKEEGAKGYLTESDETNENFKSL